MKITKIILINLLVIFVLLEGGMRIYYASTGKPPPHSDHSVYREWRWVMQRLASGKASFDTRFVHDEWAGWKNAPNIDTRPAKSGRVQTNAQGMRNTQDFSLQAEAGKPRLLIVGDSYSFGHGVSNEETYAYILNNTYLPDWQVMNLSVSASGTGQNYLMYEKYGEKYNPDIVLLGFYVLDYNRIAYSFRDYAKPMYVPQEDGSLKLTHTPVPPPEELLAQYQSGEKQIGGWHYSYAVAAFSKVITNAIKRNRRPGSLSRRTLSGIMEKFVERVRGNGAIPLWVIFPIRDIVKKDESKYDVIEEFVVAEARRLNMPVIRLQPVFRKYMKDNPDIPLWRPRDIGGHLSAAGNRLTAKTIYEYLQSNELLTAEKAVE